MKKIRYWKLFLFILLVFPLACASNSKKRTDELNVKMANQWLERVEKAHGAEIWHGKEFFSSRIRVDFGGKKRIDGKMIFDTPLGVSRLTPNAKTTIVFDGENAWLSPSSAKFDSARFDVLTWPYFLALPMKLTDPGTHITYLGERPLQGKMYQALRLTFDQGVGDSPDDWYILYVDPNNHFLRGAAYIVTFSKNKTEAEKDPHIIIYDDYTNVQGVTVSLAWEFFNWNEKEGAVGKAIGKATLKYPRFSKFHPSVFEKPKDARKVPLP